MQRQSRRYSRVLGTGNNAGLLGCRQHAQGLDAKEASQTAALQKNEAFSKTFTQNWRRRDDTSWDAYKSDRNQKKKKNICTIHKTYAHVM